MRNIPKLRNKFKYFNMLIEKDFPNNMSIFQIDMVIEKLTWKNNNSL